MPSSSEEGGKCGPTGQRRPDDEAEQRSRKELDNNNGEETDDAEGRTDDTETLEATIAAHDFSAQKQTSQHETNEAEATAATTSSSNPTPRKRKKPDSGYSIFFRTQRQLLQESGETIEQAYEREVAPLSTLSDVGHRSKALVKLIAARWKRLDRLGRMQYDILAEQQRMQKSNPQPPQQEQQSSSASGNTRVPPEASTFTNAGHTDVVHILLPLVQVIMSAQNLPAVLPTPIVSLLQAPTSSLEQALFLLHVILEIKKSLDSQQQAAQWLSAQPFRTNATSSHPAPPSALLVNLARLLIETHQQQQGSSAHSPMNPNECCIS